MIRQALGIALIWIALLGVVVAQDTQVESASEIDPIVDVEAPDATSKPFTVRISIESVVPIVYGDDIIVSVMISPQEAIDVRAVRIHPKGSLSAIYQDDSEPTEEGDPRSKGIDCPVGVTGLAPGKSIIINCRLTARVQGWKWWFDWGSLVEARTAQLEVEIVLAEGVESTATYYEYASAKFVSPKSSVIFGGFFGAILWAFFLSFSAPSTSPERQVITGWGSLYQRVSQRLPGLAAELGVGLKNLVQRAFLGGFTALVLIVLAKTTEGVEPPISLRIQDFWGGVMIGILSTPLAKWLREKLSTI